MSLTTSDDLNYGITDMYTTEDGMLYLYLPQSQTGCRMITIVANEKIYTGMVVTSAENSTIATLNEKAN